MNFYDKINDLTSSFKQTEEYKKFITLKNKIKEDSMLYGQVKDFKEKQTKQQVEYMQNGKVNEETQKELENLYSILIKNDDVRTMLEQEMKLNIMLADMQKAMSNAIKEIVEF